MLESLLAKKARLDALRPLSREALARLEAWYDVELTFTSNAIEGNTLTRQETALVVEKGFTVRGKPLKDHQEAVDHVAALMWVRAVVQESRPIGEEDVCQIHRLVVAGTLKGEAGLYNQHQRRIAGSMVVLPAAHKLPGLMKEFGAWLSGVAASPESAIEAHRRLVSIHPFTDGNGRTARLLMNLLLMRAGYPPLVVRPEDRIEYVEAIEKSQLTNDAGEYVAFMLGRLEASLDDYLGFLTAGGESEREIKP